MFLLPQEINIFCCDNFPGYRATSFILWITNNVKNLREVNKSCPGLNCLTQNFN